MATESLIAIVALVFLIVSWAWAIYFREVSALLLAVWGIAVIAILPAALGALH